MSHDLGILFGAGFGYLLLLFLIAYATDRGIVPERWVSNPLTYTLSLGVYATSWSFYGSVGFADRQGYLFLTIYLGVTIAFVLSPVLLRPLLRLTREYQLSSLADVFAFRYRSQAAGVIVTLFMLVGTLPYIALQIRAVTESLSVLTQEAPPHVLAFGFCIVLIVFAILFGARHISPREKHRGLVAAIAFESLVKLVALLLAGLFAVFGVFGGPQGLAGWLAAHPEATQALYEPVRQGPWNTLLFLAFAAAFLLPRQFHMAFAENLSPRSLAAASWAFPLFLLAFNLAIPPVLWAGKALDLQIDPDYYVLGITLGQAPDWLPIVVYLGGVSAASAMVIVTTLALSSMCLNHLLLPASYPDPRVDLYRWVLWGRRFLIGLVILAGYAFYAALAQGQGLVQLGLVSFVAVAQFLPGLVGLLYWQRATRQGFLAGLLAGITVWAVTLMLPLLESADLLATGVPVGTLGAMLGQDRWEFATFWSLAVNGSLFTVVSLLTGQSAGEHEAAIACRAEPLAPLRGVVTARSPLQFRDQLAGIIGRRAADREVRLALTDLGLGTDEARPTELRRLRERIERNLSGLVGPAMAHMIVSERLQLDPGARVALADSMRHMEEQIESSRLQLRGLTAELDRLRRYHRQVLLDLPLGVCAVSSDQQVLIWNLALAQISGLPSEQAVGRALEQLPAPWGDLLAGFARAGDAASRSLEVETAGGTRWLNVHKAEVEDPDALPREPGQPGIVMILEDLTDRERLSAELAHSGRLAFVGRLAAGVAHEIGNPVTGIASLAQILRDETDPTVVREGVEEILGQTRRIAAILKSLTSFSRSGAVGWPAERVAVADLVDEAVRLVRLTHTGKGVEFTAHTRPGLEVEGDPQRLSQVLVNLLANAGDACRPGDRVEVIARTENGRAVIEVLDPGCGVPEELHDKILEPFFTTKPVGEGTGLGLPLADSIVRDHGGTLQIESRVGAGTRVLVSLPLPAARATA
jgi:PAS domain S-box-containing protein